MVRKSSWFRQSALFGMVLVAALLTMTVSGQSPVAAANTYYVDGVYGDDGNTGSETSPWRTILHADANNILEPGDTLIVKEGTYYLTGLGVYTTVCHGTAEAPITYKAQGNVLITGAVIGFTISTNYTDVDGFTVSDCLYGIEYYQVSAGGTVRNCIVRNCSDRGLAVADSTNATFEHNLIYNMGANAASVFIGNAAGTIRVFNNTIIGGVYSIAASWGSTCHTIVRNNIMVGAGQYALIPIAPATMVASHNILYGNGVDRYAISPGLGDFNADPGLDTDFVPLPGSLAINTGVDVGLLFNGAAPDRGWYETDSTALPQVGAVTGVVTMNLPGDQPIEGAKVQTIDGKSLVMSDSDGSYSLMLPPGTYSLLCSALGYATAQVDDVVVTASEDTHLGFALNRAEAATYYVDGVNGSDSNPGTEALPWQTLGYADANRKLYPGDTVIVKEGYYGTVNLANCDGAPDQSITYKADGHVIVYGGGAGIGLLIQTDYTEIEGFEVQDCQYGIEHYLAVGGAVRNCVVNDCWDRGIAAVLTSGCTITNNLVYATPASGNAVWIEAVSGEAVVHNNTLSGGYFGIAFVGGTCNANVKNNIIYWTTYGLGFNNAGKLDHSHNIYWSVPNTYYLIAAAGDWDLYADPMLDWEYKPTTGSIAINSGVDVGIPFVGSAPDRGYFETDSTDAPNIGIIKGTVRAGLPDNPVLPEASVEAFGGATVKTGRDGTYWMGVPVGAYSVTASAGGFLADTVYNVQVTAGNEVTADFILNKGVWQTYYVDAVFGDDMNDGLSPTSAWSTISNGDRQIYLLPGDTVVVLEGTYDGPGGTDHAVQLSRTTGTALAPITYVANGAVTIDGQGTSGVGVFVQSDYTVFDGFEVTNSRFGLDFVNAAGCEVRNCTVTEAEYGIYSYGARNLMVARNRVHATGHGIFADGDRGGARIYNNTVVGAGTGISVAGSTDSVVRNNIITGCMTGLQGGVALHTHNLFFSNTYNYNGLVAGMAETNADPKLDVDDSLMAGSVAIDTGTNVGLPYAGLAPDRGAVESGLTAAPVPMSKIADLKALPNGSYIEMAVEVAATAASDTFIDGSYYVEELDRASGIKVVPQAGVPAVSVGQRLTFFGVVYTDANGERYVDVVAINGLSSGAPVRPVGASGKAIQGPGASLSGLLARIWGKVTSVASDGSYLYVDDGSGVTDSSGNIGIRVVLAGLRTGIDVLPGIDDQVGIAGLVGLTRVGGASVPAVRPRGESDLRIW